MASLDDNMIITDTALSHISRELINQREYDPASLVTVGSPAVLSGIASSFSSTSYFKKENLDFTEANKLEINFNGTYLLSTEDQVLFSLFSQNSKVIKSIISSTAIKLLINNIEVINIPVALKHEDKIVIKMQLIASGVDLLAFINNGVYQASAIGLFSSIIKDTYTLYIGSDPVDSKLYWEGSVDLKGIIISLDGTEYFSTGTAEGYTFTKVLVSDGTIELADNSSAILNHIVECPLEEIVRTNNNILLKATLADSTASVQEVGLYCSTGDKTVLFSTISNLGIAKSPDLEYSLILHINLDINVVNTTFSPEIVITEDDSVSMSDFEKVKRGYAYLTSNLERMIKGNALGLGNYRDYLDITNSISKETDTRVNALGLDSMVTRTLVDSKPSGVGYNKSQVNYRTQKELNEKRNAYNALLDYSKVQEKYQYLSEIVFTDESLTKIGSVVVNDKGEASVFSEVDYVKATYAPSNIDAFDLSISFKATATLGNAGTICCLSCDSVVQPFALRLNQSMLHLTIGQQEKLVVTKDGSNTTYIRSTSTETQGSTKYYKWTYSGLENVPSVLYTTAMAPSTTDKLYTSTYEEYSGSIASFVSGAIIDEDIVKATVGSKQSLRVAFDGNVYEIYVQNEDEDYVLFDSKVTPLRMGAAKELLFGIGYSNTSYVNHFYGIIYLANFNFIDSTNSINFLTKKIKNSIVLQDYYHIPIEARSYYNVPNLCYYSSEDYAINIQEDTLQGRKDNIAIDSSNGFSLAIKAKLTNATDKVVLSKIIPDSGLAQFTFEVKDNSIVFTIYTSDSTVVLLKELTILNFRRYLNYWSLFTLVCQKVNSDSILCKLYMNRELLSSSSVSSLTLNQGNYKLANYLEDSSSVDANYVSDILSFDGSLTEEDLYYLCNILDTNF